MLLIIEVLPFYFLSINLLQHLKSKTILLQNLYYSLTKVFQTYYQFRRDFLEKFKNLIILLKIYLYIQYPFIFHLKLKHQLKNY